MKKWLILILGMTLVANGRVNAETYTLDSFLAAVKARNRDLKMAEKEKEAAASRVKEAWSAALPSVGLEAGYNRNLTDYYMYFDKSAFAPGAKGVMSAPFKRDNEYSTAVGLKQTLFSFSVGDGIRAADQYKTMVDYLYNAGERSILTASKQLFYRCLLLKEVYEVAKSAETNALENFNLMKLKYDNGQTSQLELLQAETRWKNAATETLKSEKNMKLAMNMMKIMAGIDINYDIDISGSLVSVPELPSVANMNDVLKARPDFRAIEWEEELRKTAVSAAKNAVMPTLSGTLAFSYTAQSNAFKLDEENKFWYAGVKLSMPIYTGGLIRSKVQQNAIELGKTGIRKEKAKETIANDLENISLRLKEARLRITSAESTRQTAEKAFHIAEATTRDGLTTQLQLKDTRVVYDQSIINYYAAVYDYMEAYFDWEHATGAKDAE